MSKLKNVAVATGGAAIATMAFMPASAGAASVNSIQGPWWDSHGYVVGGANWNTRCNEFAPDYCEWDQMLEASTWHGFQEVSGSKINNPQNPAYSAGCWKGETNDYHTKAHTRAWRWVVPEGLNNFQWVPSDNNVFSSANRYSCPK